MLAQVAERALLLVGPVTHLAPGPLDMPVVDHGNTKSARNTHSLCRPRCSLPVELVKKNVLRVPHDRVIRGRTQDVV